jgi:hypothetical protein
MEIAVEKVDFVFAGTVADGLGTLRVRTASRCCVGRSIG